MASFSLPRRRRSQAREPCRPQGVVHDGDHPSRPQNGIMPTGFGKYHTSYTIEEKIEVE